MKRLTRLIIIGPLLLSLILASCGFPAGSPSVSVQTTLVHVATNAAWPPFESINKETGQLEGFDIDMMKAIAARMNLKAEFINKDSFGPLLDEMAQGKYDAAIASITITEERKKDILFSDPYFAVGQTIAVRETDRTITGKDTLRGKVGALQGTTGAKEVEKIKTAGLITYEDIAQVFQDLMESELDAVVCDNPVALVYVGKYPGKLKTVGGVFTDEHYGIAVNKEKPELLLKINAGLKAIKNEGLIEELTKKWLEVSK
jgi:polar amino acid transport system substrate-binding protein